MDFEPVNDLFYSKNHFKIWNAFKTLFIFLIFSGTALYNTIDIYNGRTIIKCEDKDGLTLNLCFCIENIKNITVTEGSIDENNTYYPTIAKPFASILIVFMFLLIITIISSLTLSLRRHRMADFLLKYGIVILKDSKNLLRISLIIFWFILLILISLFMFLSELLSIYVEIGKYTFWTNNFASPITVVITFWVVWTPIILDQYYNNIDLYTHVSGYNSLINIKVIKSINLTDLNKIIKEQKIKIKLFKNNNLVLINLIKIILNK